MKWEAVTREWLEEQVGVTIRASAVTPSLVRQIAAELCDAAEQALDDWLDRQEPRREKGDDDGVEYADPRDAMAERLLKD